MSTRPVDLDAPRSMFVDGLRRHDAGAACSVYASDARLLPPAARPILGREQIQAFWQAGLNAGMADVDYEPNEVRGSEVLMCELGRYTLRFNADFGRPTTEVGNYVHIHERQPDGSWLRTVDMFAPGGEE
jgi:ketosteroid isomerase-like protein